MARSDKKKEQRIQPGIQQAGVRVQQFWRLIYLSALLLLVIGIDEGSGFERRILCERQTNTVLCESKNETVTCTGKLESVQLSKIPVGYKKLEEEALIATKEAEPITTEELQSEAPVAAAEANEEAVNPTENSVEKPATEESVTIVEPKTEVSITTETTATTTATETTTATTIPEAPAAIVEPHPEVSDPTETKATTAPEAPVTEAPAAIIEPETEAMPNEEPEEEAPKHAPKMMISSVSTDLPEITLGDDVTVTVDLKNTSQDQALYNMMITYECLSGELIPMEDSSSRYVSFLRAGGTTSVTFMLHVSKELTNYHPKINLTMEYENEDAMSYMSSGSVQLSIQPLFGFHADDPVVPPSVESGKQGAITVNLYNTGTAEIYNVYCDLKCRGFIASGRYYVGRIAPESSVTATLTPIAADRQYGAFGDKNASKYGPVTGKLVITYEDEAGNLYSKEVGIDTVITAPPEEQEEVKPETIEYSSQWWISAVVLLVLIDAAVLIAVYYRQKHRV